MIKSPKTDTGLKFIFTRMATAPGKTAFLPIHSQNGWELKADQLVSWGICQWSHLVPGGRELADSIWTVSTFACCPLCSLLLLLLLLSFNLLLLLFPLHRLPPCPAPSQSLSDPMDNCSCISFSEHSASNLTILSYTQYQISAPVT